MATRGELLVSLFGESQVIPEGKAYQVSLDPPEAAQGPSGAGSGKGSGGRGGGSPLKAGRSRFLLVVGVITGVATYFAVEESLESAKRP